VEKVMFDKILVAVDGSEYSKKALNYAMELAEKYDGEITLIHVYSAVVPLASPVNTLGSPTMSTPASAAMAVRIAEDLKLMGEKILDDAEKTVKERRIRVEKVLKEGDAVREIVAVAQEGKFSIIVLGHRGMSRLRELVLGSVSEGVCHKATCPVMIIK
jgi:nucleotide-binding universal stress UspA family protein